MTRLGPILAVSVAVPDLGRAADAYAALLGHVQLAAGSSPGDRRWRLLGPPGASWGLVRLVESPGAPRPPTFRTLGWAALEVLVADAEAAYRRCLEVDGFEVLQPPGGVGAGGALRALQAAGPGGEGVYLTQVLGPPPEGFHLPALDGGEHRVYVAVAATRDVEATRGLFESAFGAVRVTDHGLPVRVLNQSYGLPAGTRHRVSALQLAGDTVLEIDEHPPEARPRAPGESGILSVTFAGSTAALRPSRPQPADPAPPYLGAPTVSAIGPHELPFEVVERRP